jgi:hypothetical protein
MACEMASPCPLPLPTGLVVKNGSKTRPAIASGDSHVGILDAGDGGVADAVGAHMREPADHHLSTASWCVCSTAAVRCVAVVVARIWPSQAMTWNTKIAHVAAA